MHIRVTGSERVNMHYTSDATYGIFVTIFLKAVASNRTERSNGESAQTREQHLISLKLSEILQH